MLSRLGKVAALAAVTTIVSVGGTAKAATQGTPGSTSTGSLEISASVSTMVRISGLTDISLPGWGGTGELSGSSNACVYSNGGGYTLTATGEGTNSAFVITSGNSTLSYAVQWATSSGAGSGTALTAGQAEAFTGAHATSTVCQGSTNATVIVTVAEDDLAAAPPGNYGGTLTLVVAPN